MDIPASIENDNELKLTYVIGNVTQLEARICELVISLIGSATYAGIEGTSKLPGDRRTMPIVLNELRREIVKRPELHPVRPLWRKVKTKLERLYAARNELIHSSWVHTENGQLTTRARFFDLDKTPDKDFEEFFHLADELVEAYSKVGLFGIVLGRTQANAADDRANIPPEDRMDPTIARQFADEIRKWAST